MATYGGTDTQGLTQADASGRSQKLKAQMDYAQQVNQGLQGAGQSIHQGLTQGQQAQFQQDENDKSRQLEAARSGLEFDPDSRKYVESAPAKQQRQFKEGQAVAQYGLEKDKAVSDVLQRQQEINQRGDAMRQETGLRQQHSATEMARANVDAMREERLMTQFMTETGENRLKAQLQLDTGTDDRLEKLTDQMVKLQSGDLAAQKETIAMLAPAAQNNPRLNQALQQVLSGQTTPEGIKDIMSTLQEQRNQIALSGAAKTGYISPLVDPSSPMMQEFYAFRNLYTRRMEGDMAAELEILQNLPQGEKEGFKDYLRLSSKSQADRVRLANQAAAQGFMGITMARRAAAGGGLRGGQSGGTGPSQPGKLGGTGQQQQGGGFNPASRQYPK